MAYITEFTIKGLAGRKTTYSQKLNRDINVFFGFNGSGKTSLLKILHSAMETKSSILQNVPFTRAEVKVYSDVYKKIFTHTITKSPKANTQFSGHEQNLFEIYENELTSEKLSLPEWKITPDEKKEGTGWHHRYLPISRLMLMPNQRYLVNPTSRASEEDLDEQFQRALESLWSRYMGEISKQVRKAQEEGLANILEGIIYSDKSKIKDNNLDVEKAYKLAKSFLNRHGAKGAIGSLSSFKERYSKSQLLKSVVSDIDKVERETELAMTPRDNMQELIERLFSSNKRVTFSDSAITVKTDDNTSIKLSSLSSGEKQILRILIECLYVESSSIIIDEPELSMHVDWQRELISAMRSINNEAQLILATHSPEIMAEIDDSKIFRL
jgi:predicted ATP-dependent endonuclease of OLD family